MHGRCRSIIRMFSVATTLHNSLSLMINPAMNKNSSLCSVMFLSRIMQLSVTVLSYYKHQPHNDPKPSCNIIPLARCYSSLILHNLVIIVTQTHLSTDKFWLMRPRTWSRIPWLSFLSCDTKKQELGGFIFHFPVTFIFSSQWSRPPLALQQCGDRIQVQGEH